MGFSESLAQLSLNIFGNPGERDAVIRASGQEISIYEALVCSGLDRTNIKKHFDKLLSYGVCDIYFHVTYSYAKELKPLLEYVEHMLEHEAPPGLTYLGCESLPPLITRQAGISRSIVSTTRRSRWCSWLLTSRPRHLRMLRLLLQRTMQRLFRINDRFVTVDVYTSTYEDGSQSLHSSRSRTDLEREQWGRSDHRPCALNAYSPHAIVTLGRLRSRAHPVESINSMGDHHEYRTVAFGSI